VLALAEGAEREAAAQRPQSLPSRCTEKRAGGKLPTQGPAPNLPETCKHETIIDEMRLESHRF
jgi:hypothetical protein